MLTPDLGVGFPSQEFFQYVIAHTGVVTAALFPVIGLRLAPRRGAVRQTLLVTFAYTAMVGLVDALSGADYMFLREPPSNWTLLRVLGPWPWYLVSTTALAVVLLVILDVPSATLVVGGPRRLFTGHRPRSRAGPVTSGPYTTAPRSGFRPLRQARPAGSLDRCPPCRVGAGVLSDELDLRRVTLGLPGAQQDQRMEVP